MNAQTRGARHRATLTPHARRRRALAGAATALALLAPAGVGATLAVTDPVTQAVQAADYALGEWHSGYFHGLYRDVVNGQERWMLCADVNAAEAIGVGPVGAWVGQAPGLNANQTAGLAALIDQVIASGSNSEASYLAEAYWIVQGTYEGTHYPRALQMVAFINGYHASSAPGPAAVVASVAVDSANNYAGELVLSTVSPSPATLTITLTNGVFDATGTNQIVGEFSAGDRIALTGVPPVQGQEYEISGSIDLVAETAAGYSGQVTVVEYGGGYQALVMSPGANPTVVTGHAEFRDPSPRSSAFFPTLSTRVSTQRITTGVFSDSMSFALGDNGAGVVNEWPRSGSGSYYPVTGECTVYGPLSQEPALSAQVPAGVPVAGTATITTTAADGPTASYSYDVTVPENSAYYTAVCTIDYANQNAATQAWLSDGYRFSDAYGQTAETAVVPMELEISTSVSAPALGWGEALTDTVTATVTNGGWLSDVDGNPAEIVADVTYYQLPDGTEVVESDTAPADAVQIGTATVTLTENGVGVTTGEQLTPNQWGPIVAQACVRESDVVEASCDRWGLPSETALVIRPQILTDAVDSTTVGGEAFDRFEVVGQLPTSDSGITVEATFLAYAAEHGQVLCTADNLVLDTSSTPISVTDDTREGRSPELARSRVTPGDILWVGQLWYVDEDGQRELVDEGDCGEADEITHVTEELQNTGSPMPTAALIAGIGIILAGSALLIIRAARARRTAQ